MKKNIKRSLAKIVTEISDNFKVLLLTGPRQVGKTFLLQEVQKKTRSYITLDDFTVRTAAIQDPAGFIERLNLPVLIDEVQYAPNLFPYIKMEVDRLKKPGLFWLTGSQQFSMMKNVTESLAGRIGILNLQGISLAEEQKRANNLPFLPDLNLLKERQKTAKSITIKQLYHKIWRGSYPDIVVKNGKNWEHFYDSYITTYITHDIQDYLGIKNKTAFLKFMQIIAARTGQLVNYDEIAKDVGLSPVTIKSWIDILLTSGIIYLLSPYFNNITKRLIKTPKLYFMDTGLCCFLTGWLNPEVLERGAMNGAILENFVISEIIKSYLHCGRKPRLYFYRDKNKNEIDLLIEQNGELYPIEVKKTATPNKHDFKNFALLEKLKIKVGRGAVICLTKNLVPLEQKVDAVPVSWI